YVLLVFFVSVVFLLRTTPQKRPQLLTATGLFLFSGALLATAHYLFGTRYDELATALHVLALITGGIAVVELISTFLYDLVLRRLRDRLPRIIRDLLVALAYIGVALWAIHQHGVTISGIVT